jgi:anti-anti-sigma factor
VAIPWNADPGAGAPTERDSPAGASWDAQRHAQPEGVSLRVEMRGGHLALVGDVDAYTAPVVIDAVEHTLGFGAPWILVDLSRVTLLDAAGVQALLDAQAEARRRDILLRVHHPSSVARRVLELVGEFSRLSWGSQN